MYTAGLKNYFYNIPYTNYALFNKYLQNVSTYLTPSIILSD